MKAIRILIITLIILLVLGCVSFATLYFATDVFKSDKDLFLKYASQINLKEFINLEEYSNYLKRTETQGHGNEGEFSISISQMEQSINESTKYHGYVDPANKKTNYEININKDNETLLTMNYLKSQDLYGILFKDVVNQYIVVENNNLKEFATKLGIEDTEDIPNKIEIKKLTDYFSYEEISSIYTKYLNMAFETISEDNFYKLKKENISLNDKTVEADGYAIDLKEKDLQAISIKILENAKNDEQIFNILNRINSDFTFENYQDSIEEMLDEISGEITDEENIITISVYKQGKETVKLSINNDYISIEKNSNGITLKINDDEINFSIAKTSSAEEQENFDIIITVNPKEAEPSIININLSRVGAFTSNNVTFDMNISTKPVAEGNLNIELKNTVNFLAVPEFEEFKEENHLVINTLSQEQITNLFTNLGNLLLEKLKDEIYISMVKDLATTKNQMIQNATDILQTQEIQTFNSKFTVYEGVKKGAEIIGLQNIINSSNTTNVEHIVAYSGVSNEAIQTSKTYKVSLEQDLEGYVNKVIVEEFN